MKGSLNFNIELLLVGISSEGCAKMELVPAGFVLALWWGWSSVEGDFAVRAAFKKLLCFSIYFGKAYS